MKSQLGNSLKKHNICSLLSALNLPLAILAVLLVLVLPVLVVPPALLVLLVLPRRFGVPTARERAFILTGQKKASGGVFLRLRKQGTPKS